MEKNDKSKINLTANCQKHKFAQTGVMKQFIYNSLFNADNINELAKIFVVSNDLIYYITHRESAT